MAPHSRLVHLLQDHSNSLAAQLLGLLPPTTLIALSASCKGLQAVVASQPEETWKVGHTAQAGCSNEPKQQPKGVCCSCHATA